MNLSAGSRLGPYDILEPLGAGGMGEVYRARDRRLDREVAIKILPSHLSSNPQFRERFEREARAISQLNHPHICTLHDVGHDAGTSYLVMELLHGDSLADRLSKGPLPVEQVLRYGVQMAAALDRAHRQGIIHRDLKPSNVMITRDGAKLLDFGLAKGAVVAFSSSEGQSATEHKPLTQEGTILGTFQYMAPEQLEGEEADARTDIFALGAVVYEMATGTRAFEGKTKTSLIAAIVSGEPAPMSRLQPLTPPALEHVVRKCLAKDREDRWQSAYDVAEELRWIGEAGSQGTVAAPIISRRKRRDRLLLALAIVAILTAGLLGVLLWRARSEVPHSIHATIVPPPGTQFEYSRIDSAALTVSPDGHYVTFAASNADGETMLWLRAIDSDKAQALPGTEGGASPFWSPDSRSIGFFSHGKLKRMDVAGGPAINLADASDGRGGSWNTDGVILFEPDWRKPIHRVSANGGAATQVTTLDQSLGETTHRWPHFLPDGRHFLYLAGNHRVVPTSDVNAIYVGSIDSKERKLLVHARTQAIYVPGYVLFARESWLLAQKFNPRTLTTIGDPTRVAENVTVDSGYFRAAFGASGDGTLTYFTGSPTARTQLVWYDRNGKRLSKVGESLAGTQSNVVQSLRLSPDEKRLALDIGDPTDVWIFDLDRGTRTRFTSDPMNDASPVWSPDGSRIAYSNDHDIIFALFQKPTDGLSRESLLSKGSKFIFATDWSPDGKNLAVYIADPEAPDVRVDVAILPLTGGDAKPIPFADTEFVEMEGRFSRDGRWLTYQSNETGRLELYAVSFPSRLQKRQLTSNGVYRYTWRRDGREILYLDRTRNLMSIAVNGDVFSSPTPLFRFDAPILAIDVTRDGSRILAAETERTVSEPITIVSRWH